MQQQPGRPPSVPNTGWRVTDQIQVTELDAMGRPARGMRVHFQTGKGTPGSVFVPDVQYNPESVRAAVAAQAAVIDQVGALTG